MPGSVVPCGVVQEYCIGGDDGRDKTRKDEPYRLQLLSSSRKHVTPKLIMIAMGNRLEDKPLIGKNKFGVIGSMIALR
jgi:hypothetical protein